VELVDEGIVPEHEGGNQHGSYRNKLRCWTIGKIACKLQFESGIELRPVATS
jgi:hypothetical protein